MNRPRARGIPTPGPGKRSGNDPIAPQPTTTQQRRPRRVGCKKPTRPQTSEHHMMVRPHTHMARPRQVGNAPRASAVSETGF
eukprot:2885966-Prymnesium_polylepis.1